MLTSKVVESWLSQQLYLVVHVVQDPFAFVLQL